MSENDSKVILGQGVSLYKWIADLQSALVRRRCIGHVFHDIHGIKAIVCPTTPEKAHLSPEAYAAAVSEYELELQKFQEGEIEARSILAARIERAICPPNLMSMSAKNIYEHVLSVREEGANTPWETSVRELLMTKLTSNADNYCNLFMQYYLDANNAAQSMPTLNAEGLNGDQGISFGISAGLAGYLFVLGTEGITWLDTWRQTKIYDVNNKYVPLDVMMSTLRQVAKGREVVNYAQVAVASNEKKPGSNGRNGKDNDPEAICKMCKHKHRNKNCFKQHPQLRSKIKNKGKARAAFENTEIEFSSESDSDSDCVGLSAVARASSSKFNNRLLYDTGASHHFMRKKGDFLFLKNLRKPFEFDQAVGNSRLSYQESCQVTIGNVTIELSNVLYSPESSCDIISAVRLKEDHGIVAANQMETLIRTNASPPNEAIAKLMSIEGVLFIQGISSTLR